MISFLKSLLSYIFEKNYLISYYIFPRDDKWGDIDRKYKELRYIIISARNLAHAQKKFNKEFGNIYFEIESIKEINKKTGY